MVVREKKTSIDGAKPIKASSGDETIAQTGFRMAVWWRDDDGGKTRNAKLCLAAVSVRLKLRPSSFTPIVSFILRALS